MTKRPNIKESINLLEQYKEYNIYCKQALNDYYNLVDTNEFLASLIVVETVYNFYCNTYLKSTSNG